MTAAAVSRRSRSTLLLAGLFALPSCGDGGARPPAGTAHADTEAALGRIRAATDLLLKQPPPPVPAPDGALRRAFKVRRELGDRRALKQFEREQRERPDDAELRFATAQIRIALGQYGAALIDLERALDVGLGFGGGAGALLSYGECLARLGRSSAARAAYAAHLEVAPDHAATHAALGRLALHEGDAEAATESFTRAEMALDAATRRGEPESARQRAQILMLLADALVQRERFAEAKAALQRSVEIDPQPAEVHYKLARVLRRLGDEDGAAAAEQAYRERSAESRH